jgi:hypothetical protein
MISSRIRPSSRWSLRAACAVLRPGGTRQPIQPIQPRQPCRRVGAFSGLGRGNSTGALDCAELSPMRRSNPRCALHGLSRTHRFATACSRSHPRSLSVISQMPRGVSSRIRSSSRRLLRAYCAVLRQRGVTPSDGIGARSWSLSRSFISAYTRSSTGLRLLRPPRSCAPTRCSVNELTAEWIQKAEGDFSSRPAFRAIIAGRGGQSHQCCQSRQCSVR